MEVYTKYYGLGGFAHQQMGFNSEDSQSIAAQMHIMVHLSKNGGSLIAQSAQAFIPLGIRCAIEWPFATMSLAKAALDSAKHKSAIPSSFADKIREAEKAIPERSMVVFGLPDEVSQGDWFVSGPIFVCWYSVC